MRQTAVSSSPNVELIDPIMKTLRNWEKKHLTNC